MSEFDDLVANDGVLMACPVSPHAAAEATMPTPRKSTPVAVEMAHGFCTAITMRPGSITDAIDCGQALRLA